MANLNKYLNNDYFSIGRADNISIVRIINITALSILIIISFVFIFFLTVYSTTYYSRIGDLEETIKVIISLFRNIKQRDNYTLITSILA